MTTQTGEKPPIVIEPGVEPFLDDDMLQIRDLVLGCATDVTEERGILIKQVRIRHYYYPDDCDWVNVIFEIHVDADEDSAFAYWEALCDAESDAEGGLNMTLGDTLNDHVGVFVEWLRTSKTRSESIGTETTA